MKLINNMEIYAIQGLQIDKDDNILISSRERFNIYDLKRNLLKLWKLDDNLIKSIRTRKIFSIKIKFM
jgi:hypothetical protein